MLLGFVLYDRQRSNVRDTYSSVLAELESTSLVPSALFSKPQGVQMSNVALIREVRTHLPGESVRPTEGLVPVITVMARAGDVESVLRELSFLIDGALGASVEPASPDGAGHIVSIAELCVDARAHRVTVAGQEVSLTSLEFKLLSALIGRRDRAFTRDGLLREVWRCSAQCKTRTVDTHVKRLRDKLRSAGRFIQTIRGMGYRFSENTSGAGAQRRRKGLAAAHVHSVPAPIAVARP